MKITGTILTALLFSSSPYLSAQSAQELPGLAAVNAALEAAAPPVAPAAPSGKAAGALDSGAGPVALAAGSAKLEETNYDRVKALYETGLRPAPKDLIGFNYGRCFKPNGKIDGLTVYAKRKELAGPIDPDYPQVVGIVSQADWSVRKNDPAYKQQYKEEFAEVSLSPAVAKPDHLELELGSWGDPSGLFYEVRKNGDWLALHSPLEATEYCYTYFKDQPNGPLGK